MGLSYAVFDKTVFNQVDRTCYAHAIAEALISTQSRRLSERCSGMFSRQPPQFWIHLSGFIGKKWHEQIVQRIVSRFGNDGADTFAVLQEQCRKACLFCEWITENQAQIAISQKRVIVATFSLSNYGWQQFSQTLQNPLQLIQKLEKGKKGHAVAIIGMEDGKQGQTKYWKIKNSWGQTFADKGYFKVKMYTLPMNFIDVYF